MILEHSTRVAFNDSTGAVVAWFDYSPYGKVARSFETSTMIRYTYTGQERDSETGLMNYKARMYDPAIGRFYAMDPMGQTPSFYNYCGNNPVSFTDPDGEWFWMAVAIAYGAFQGHEIGKEAGKKGWDLAGYTFLGAAIGGANGFIGTEIAAMDFIGSGTLGLIASSTYSSYGMYELSGRTREFTTSVGFGSMNWSKGRFDYFMDGNNTVLDDIGYFFGGMTNLSEGIQYIDSKTGWESTWWDEVDELAKNNKPGDSVNPTTLKQNILNENYPGGDNPKSIEGHDWWGRIKGDTFVDLPAQLHDAAWTRMGLHADKYGITLATTTTSYLADWRFVGQNLYLATKHVRSSPLLSMKAYSIGIGFAAIIYPKSVLIGRNAENRL